MDYFILPLAGTLGVMTALAHGYLGETRIISLATFPNAQARGFVRAMWQLSTATWIAGSLMIAAAPFVFADPVQRKLVLLVACLPMIWGIACNAWISKGRHFGWMALAAVVGLTVLGASF
jgi:hypothetical protein